MARIFKYGPHRFERIDAAFSAEDVRRALVQHFPKLATARIQETALPNGDVEIEFIEAVGQKG